MEEVINYVNQSPENSNPNVLRGILQNINSEEGSGGSGGGAYYVDMTVDGRTYTSGKTYKEIEDAYNAGSVVIGRHKNSYDQDVLLPLAKIGYDSDQSAYCTYFISGVIELNLICLTKTDYPSYEEFI